MDLEERQDAATPEVITIARHHHQAGRLADAEAVYRRVLETQPDHPDALHLLGLIAHQTGRYEVAVEWIEKAVGIQPSNADFLNHLGEAHRSLGRFREAESWIRRALAVEPGHALAHNNLAVTLKQMGRLDEAERHYQEAIRIDDSFALAKLNYALLRLLRGDYAQGLELFEARFMGGDEKAIGHDRALLAELGVPRWQGEAIPGKTLLLWTEQGLGDSLMMMRYLPLIRSRGVGSLLVYCHEPLVRLMQTADGVDEVVSRDEPLPAGEFHCHIPMMSLPLLFETRLDTIPRGVPYLRVPEWLDSKWAGKLSEFAPPRVGLTWASGKYTRTNQSKSIPLDCLDPLLTVGGVTFVSLQKGNGADRGKRPGRMITAWIDECRDLLDTAALINQLDLVISVDTAVAHLAGALGKPVWLLNQLESDWRWMLDREDSPWYPTMRIFRQTRAGIWDDVIERVAAELGKSSHGPVRKDVSGLGRPGPSAQASSVLRRWIWRLWR
jgi:Flp pilus assembly protein TadD